MAAIKSEMVWGDRAAAPLHLGQSPLELFAAAVALLIPIAYTAGLEADAWSARTALLLIVSAVGLPILLSQTRGPSPLAARSAVAFLLIGSASAVLSPNHTTAVWGLYNQGTGLFFMASLAAAWAIGRSIRTEARPLVERALIVGVLVNVGVALLASVVDLSAFSAGLIDAGGRSAALAGNPVHLGTLAVLGLALFVPRYGSAPARWAIPVAATATAVQLSGTRVALVVIAAIVLWAGLSQGARIGAGLAVLIFLGLAVGSVIVPSEISATGRSGVVLSAESWQARPETWFSARHALIQRPLLGIGPGQFRTATSPYRPISVGLLEGPEKLFTDAHNLFVEYATTTGILGVSALVIWLLAASRSTRGCLLAGALAVLAIHLVEPQSVIATPLLFLALGASASASGGVVQPWRGRGAVHWIIPTCTVVAATSVAAVFLLGQFDLRQARLDLRVAPASQANHILPAWPETASRLATVWLFQGIVANSDSDARRGRYWQGVALSRDDTDPQLWNALAELDESQGMAEKANVEYVSALRFNPTSVVAMNGLARLAGDRCDLEQQRYWLQRSLRVGVPVAPSLVPAGSQPPARVCATT